MANRDLGVLDVRIAGAIINACDRLIAGEMRDQFITDFIQGGAGTSTNMNFNEVIANLALEELGHRKGGISSSTERSREFWSIDQRCLSDGLSPGADPAPVQFHERVTRVAGVVLRQGPGVRKGPENGPHALAGCRADVARPGVPQVLN